MAMGTTKFWRRFLQDLRNPPQDKSYSDDATARQFYAQIEGAFEGEIRKELYNQTDFDAKIEEWVSVYGEGVRDLPDDVQVKYYLESLKQHQLAQHIQTAITMLEEWNNTSIGYVACCLIRTLSEESKFLAEKSEELHFDSHTDFLSRADDWRKSLLSPLVSLRLLLTMMLNDGVRSIKVSWEDLFLNFGKLLIDLVVDTIFSILFAVVSVLKTTTYRFLIAMVNKYRPLAECFQLGNLIALVVRWLFKPTGYFRKLKDMIPQMEYRTVITLGAESKLRKYLDGLAWNTALRNLLYIIDQLLIAVDQYELCALPEQSDSDLSAADTTSTDSGISVGPGIKASGIQGADSPDGPVTVVDPNDPHQNQDRTDHPQGGSQDPWPYAGIDPSVDALKSTIRDQSSALGSEDLFNPQQLFNPATPAETERFLINRLGIPSDIAKDQVRASRLGRCAEGLSQRDMTEVMEILTDLELL